MTSIIFQNVIDNIFDSTNNINSFFENYDKYNTNIYNLLYKLPKEYLVIYIFFMFLIYNFIARFNINNTHIFVLLICSIFIYFIANNNYSNFISYTEKKKKDLKFLHKLMYDNKDKFISANSNNFFITPIKPYEVSYLYLNPALIEVFINIKNISSFNISAYVDSLIHCNNIIGIEFEAKIGLDRNYLNYNSAVLEKNRALNALNSAIYNIPESLVQKYMKAIEILHKLLYQHLKNIGNYFKNDNKLKGIRVDRVPDDLYDIESLISPNDTQTKDYISTYNMYV
jgi:phage gp36-like protein